MQRGQVGGQDLRLRRELCLQESFGALGRAVVEPGQQAQGEHVLRPLLVLAAQVERRQRLDGDRGQAQLVDVVGVQAAVGQRALGVADLLQVAGAELVGVDDQRRAAGEVGQVGLERGRVHRDEHVGGIARRQHVVVGEMELEAGDPWQRALRSADLGREVRQGRQVVAQDGRLGREPVTGELHAVAAVSGEPDDDAIQTLHLLGAHCRINLVVLAGSSYLTPSPVTLPTPS